MPKLIKPPAPPAPPAPTAPTLPQQKADFTAEGAPPPGLVSGVGPIVAATPAPPRPGRVRRARREATEPAS